MTQVLRAEDHRHLPRIVLVCFLSLCIIFGIRLSFSVFFAEFVLGEGWSNEAAASIFSLNMLFFAATAPLAGMALDRYGPRLVFGVGAGFMAAGLWLSSQAASGADLLLAYGIVFGIGLGITGLGPVASVIAGWTTPAHRGRAIGIAFAGTGVGSLVFVPLSNALIDAFTWRQAYLILALTCLLILLPLLTLGLKRPPQPHLPKREAHARRGQWRLLLRDRGFWALLLVGMTALGPIRSLTVHQVAYMESVGVERGMAAGAVGLAGMLTTAAFIGLGWASDRFGRVSAFMVGSLGLMAAVGALILMRHGGLPALLAVYALVYALGEATRSSQTTALASDVFGARGLGLINGIVGGTFGVGAALGPWLAGRIRDQSGSYDGGLMMILAMVIVSVVAFVFVARRKAADD